MTGTDKLIAADVIEARDFLSRYPTKESCPPELLDRWITSRNIDIWAKKQGDTWL
jgi:hypothetical protein